MRMIGPHTAIDTRHASQRLSLADAGRILSLLAAPSSMFEGSSFAAQIVSLERGCWLTSA
jgi:hypothetical protein